MYSTFSIYHYNCISLCKAINQMVKKFIIEFDNHRKILTLSRQYLHKCIHTMAPLHSRKMKI